MAKGRPRLAYSKQVLHCRVDEKVIAELLLRCYNPSYSSGVEYGAQAALVERALREYFERNPIRQLETP